MAHVHKERRNLALCKLGIDRFSTSYRVNARVWGVWPNAMVIHECMSLGMMMYQYGNFLTHLKSTEVDPYYPDIELDYFGKYHLRCNAYWMEVKFPR